MKQHLDSILDELLGDELQAFCAGFALDRFNFLHSS